MKVVTSGYEIYNAEAKKRRKINPLSEMYPPLPNKKYAIFMLIPLGITEERCNMTNLA